MPENVVTVTGGKIQGAEHNGVVSFKGIPFAAAPVGDLRWRAPQPVVPWVGVRKATEYGFDCMQNPFPGDAAPLGGPISEDCLYLNVWKPAKASKKPLPVMVWIYGGGYVNGGTSPAVYSGEHFAESGVIFVSVNYRLGRFGFFGHPALSAENKGEMLGNYAFMDQVAGLRWVQDNIAKFGGDANNVTIFGESAGGGSVNTLLTANPEVVSGLFSKVISQSGGGRTRGWWATRLRKGASTDPNAGPSAEEMGEKFANDKGIKGSGTEVLAALRALPASEIVDGLNMANGDRSTFPGPMIDGKLVVQTTEDAIRKGDYQKVPYMAGANSFEWIFMATFMPDMANKLATDFLQVTGIKDTEAFQRFDVAKYDAPLAYLGGLIRGDSMFLEPARYVVSTMTNQGSRSWLYRFDYVAQSIRDEAIGAYHATEIPFVFKTISSRYENLSKEDWRMAQAMHENWVAFAKSGKPTSNWKAFNNAKPKVYLFANGTGENVADPAKERLDAVEKFVTQSKKP